MARDSDADVGLRRDRLSAPRLGTTLPLRGWRGTKVPFSQKGVRKSGIARFAEGEREKSNGRKRE